jgi:hypothetical protein
LSTFTIDDSAAPYNAFSQTTYLLDAPTQIGPQVINAGTLATSQGGLRSLSIATTYLPNAGGNGVLAGYYPMANNPPLPGFALELAGQVGGFVQLFEQPAQPLVAATQCPSFAKPQTYQFITIPAALAPAGVTPHSAGTWDPTSEAAYGSVDISSAGGAISLQNIKQSVLPALPSGAQGSLAFQAPASVAGVCGPTFFGNTISVPGQLMIANPGDGQSTTGQATVGVGASAGLLVEDNGISTVNPPPGSSYPIPYVNVLGAGTGAVGLPVPSSPLNAGGIVGAQYLGFIYGAGVSTSSPTGWTSNLASFGAGNSSASCAALAASTGALANGIYGGDFLGNDPGNSPNCDLAIDLGTSSSNNNSLYTGATVWVGGQYLQDSATTLYPAQTAFTRINAVAIAGQINGKYAVFLIGVDTVQPWAIYLLQSN